MTTEGNVDLQHIEGFLAPFMLAAMLALALPQLTRVVTPSNGPEVEAAPFTPEQAAEIAAAFKALAVDSGNVTSPADAGSSGLVDASKDWPAGMHWGRLLRVTDGSGRVQARVIQGNSENTLLADTPWTRPMDASSAYVILNS